MVNFLNKNVGQRIVSQNVITCYSSRVWEDNSEVRHSIISRNQLAVSSPFFLPLGFSQSKITMSNMEHSLIQQQRQLLIHHLETVRDY